MYVVAASVLMFTACKDDPKDTLSVTPTVLEYDSNGIPLDVSEVTVTTNVKKWSATPNANWITTYDDHGMFAVSVDKWNNFNDGREGTITVRAGKAEETVTIKQSASGMRFNACEVVYYGEYYEGSGAANFEMYLYNSPFTDKSPYLKIEGFSTLLSNLANYKLDAVILTKYSAMKN